MKYNGNLINIFFRFLKDNNLYSIIFPKIIDEYNETVGRLKRFGLEDYKTMTFEDYMYNMFNMYGFSDIIFHFIGCYYGGKAECYKKYDNLKKGIRRWKYFVEHNLIPSNVSPGDFVGSSMKLQYNVRSVEGNYFVDTYHRVLNLSRVRYINGVKCKTRWKVKKNNKIYEFG